MEILQKNTYFIFHMATVTRPQQPSTLGSSQVQLLLVGDRCKMVAIKHHPENTRPARDLEMPNVGGFGPNRLVSTPSDNEPVHLLPSAAFDFAFHVTRSKVHSTTWQKIRPTVRIHPLWTSAVLTLPCKNTRHGNWSEVLCSEENNSSYAAVQTQFEYKKNPIGLSMIKDYILWLQPGPTRSEVFREVIVKNVTKTNSHGVSNMSQDWRGILNIDPNNMNTRMMFWGLHLAIGHFIFIKTLENHHNTANSWLLGIPFLDHGLFRLLCFLFLRLSFQIFPLLNNTVKCIGEGS